MYHFRNAKQALVAGIVVALCLLTFAGLTALTRAQSTPVAPGPIAYETPLFGG